MPQSIEKRVSRRMLMLLTSAAALAVAAHARQARADVSESWIAGGNGNWANAANWSPNTNYPNNGTPAGTNYQASVSFPGSNAYSVLVNTNIAVDSLSIGSSNATVNDTAGTLTVGGMTVTSGAFQLNGGTLSGGTSGATVSLSSPSEFTVLGGTLNAIQFTGGNVNDNGVLSNLYVQNGLTMGGGALDINGEAARVYFTGASQTIDNLTINANPISNPNYSPTWCYLMVGGPASTGPVTLTLGPNATLQGFAQINDNLSISGNTLLNNGTINANVNQQQMDVNTSNFTNNGTAEATNGGALYISAQNWTNSSSGTISANASILSLGVYGGTWNNAGAINATHGSLIYMYGNVTTAQFGSLNPSSDSNVELLANINNTGANLALSSGIFTLGSPAGSTSGSITGGTIALSNGAAFSVTDGTLTSVQVTGGDITVDDQSHTAELTLVGGLTGNGTNNLKVTGGTVLVEGTQTISNINVNGGSGQMVFMVQGANNPTLTIASGVTVSGSPSFSDYTNYSDYPVQTTPSTLVNNGAFIANGSSLAGVANTHFTNNGTIQITGAGFAMDSPNFTNNGTIDLVNSELASSTGLNIGGGTLSLGGSSIINGVLTLATASQFDVHIGGTTQGAGYDYVLVGMTQLGGDLDISFTNGFQTAITPSETFDILTVAVGQNEYGVPYSLSGSFLNVANGGRLETLDGWGSFQVNYGSGAYANEIVLSDFEPPVPEPTFGCALIAGSSLLLARRRRTAA